MTEYAIMLFLVLVVAAGSWKVFGQNLEKGMGKTTSNLEHDDPNASPAPPPPGGASSAATTSHGENGSTGGSTGGGFGGARVPPKEKEDSSLPKFARVAIAVVLGGAAFFAAMKGKHSA